MRALAQAEQRDGRRVTVPSAASMEWWRRRTDLCDRILGSVDVEPAVRVLSV